MRTIMGLSICLLFELSVAAAGSTRSFSLQSNTFRNNGLLPLTVVYNASGCTGANQSPELHWSSAPRRTKSFALIMHDPDAKAPGGWYHWVLYDISPRVHELAAGANVGAAQSGVTSFRERKYGGPCPPPGSGTHHYVFTLYALDAARFIGRGANGPTLERSIRSHVLGTARSIALYKR